jgi:hypothetical protein
MLDKPAFMRFVAGEAGTVTNQMAAPGQFYWDKAMHDADAHAAPNETRAHALLREAGVNPANTSCRIVSWQSAYTEIAVQAMRKLGWQNTFVTWGHLEAEEEMVRLKDPNLLVLGANALFFNGDLPIHKEIIAAAKAAGSTSNPNQLTEGWIAGLTIETLLKQIGSDNSSERIRSAMQTLKIDTKGLRGGPIEFTPTNHFRTTQYYRIYKWDSASNQITIPKNWFKYEIDPAGAGSR